MQSQSANNQQASLLPTIRAGIFLAVLLAVQMVGLPSPITGVLVNAILIFSLLALGLKYGLIIAVLSPLGGIISGSLPTPLYPVVPVIMGGNLLLSSSYYWLRSQAFWQRHLFPAAGKALLIWGAGNLVISQLNAGDRLKWLFLPVATMQFFTAIFGLQAGERLYAAINRQHSDLQPEKAGKKAADSP